MKPEISVNMMHIARSISPVSAANPYHTIQKDVLFVASFFHAVCQISFFIVLIPQPIQGKHNNSDPQEIGEQFHDLTPIKP